MTANQKFIVGSVVGVGAVTLIAGGLLTVDTSAQIFNAQKDGETISETRQDRRESRREDRRESRRATFEAIHNRDYNAWVQAIQDSRRAEILLEFINQDNFNTYVEMIEAKRDGNDEEAEALREELGLPSRGDIEVANEEVKVALEAEDFAAWQEAVARTGRGSKMLKVINTQEEFDLLVEIHSNKERNREIAKELGLDFGRKGGSRGSSQEEPA